MRSWGRDANGQWHQVGPVSVPVTSTATNAAVQGAVNGRNKNFFLEGNNGEQVQANISVPQIYKADWQGNQLQYSTPRTNRFTYSQNFANAAWGATGVAITPNQLAPDGSSNASLLSFAGSLQIAPHLVQSLSGYTPINGDIHNVSLWVYSLTSTTLDIQCATFPGTQYNNEVTLNIPAGVWTQISNKFTISGITTDTTTSIYIVTRDGVARNIYAYAAQDSSILAGYIPTTTAPVTVTDYTFVSPSNLMFSTAPLSGSVITWNGTFVSGTTTQGSDDDIWITTLCQCLKLSLNESPFFANYGLPIQQTITTQVFPDYYVSLIQAQFAPYFASLSISKKQNAANANPASPVYNVNILTHQGVSVSLVVT